MEFIMRLNNRRRLDYKSINYHNFPKDFFGDVNAQNEVSVLQYESQPQEHSQPEQPSEFNGKLKFKIGHRIRELNKNARYICIKDSVTNKLRILRGGLPAIEGSAQKQSRESSLEMPNSPPCIRSEKKQRLGFENIETLQRSANQIKTAFTNMSNHSSNRRKMIDLTKASHILFKRNPKQLDYSDDSRKNNSLSGFYQERINMSNQMQPTSLKDCINSQKRTLFNLKANFNRNRLNVSKNKDADIPKQIRNCEPICTDKVKEDESIDDSLKISHKIYNIKRDDCEEDQDCKTTRASTTRNFKIKISNLSIFDHEEKIEASTSKNNLTKRALQIEDREDDCHRSESQCSMKHIQQLSNLQKDQSEAQLCNTKEISLSHRRFRQKLKEESNGVSGARYFSENCSSCGILNPEENSNPISNQNYIFKCSDSIKFCAPRKTAYFGCSASIKEDISKCK